MRRSIFYLILLFKILNQTSFSIIFGPVSFQRRSVLRQLGSMVASTTSLILSSPHSVDAFSSIPPNVPTSKNVPKMSIEQTDAKNVAYRAFAMDVMGEKIPVAMWYQINNNQEEERVLPSAKYLHRISVRRIGELLARWDFVPQFVAKDYQLKPTLNNVFDGASVPVPSSGPVVLFAHGYLGSRFDLSHIAEALAQDGTISNDANRPQILF